MNPSSGRHHWDVDISYRSSVRSRYGVDPIHQPSLEADRRPLLPDTQTRTIEEVAGSASSSEDDDAFQWFVNLFVAEYTSES